MFVSSDTRVFHSTSVNELIVYVSIRAMQFGYIEMSQICFHTFHHERKEGEIGKRRRFHQTQKRIAIEWQMMRWEILSSAR